jgi:hypothetical protein
MSLENRMFLRPAALIAALLISLGLVAASPAGTSASGFAQRNLAGPAAALLANPTIIIEHGLRVILRSGLLAGPTLIIQEHVARTVANPTIVVQPHVARTVLANPTIIIQEHGAR